MLLFIVYVTILARYYLLHKFQRKKSCDYIYVEGDVLWDSKTTLLYPLICCLAGFFSGMFGLFYIGNIWGSAISVQLVKTEKQFENKHNILVGLKLPISKFFN
jgi:uncharacterized membrane protein YfcA